RANDLADDIAQDAITLVRNDAKLLPLNLTATTRVFNLAITNGDDRAFIATPFIGAMSRGGIKMDTKVLNELISRNARLVGISFGNPFILMGFPKLQTYIVAYGDMPSLHEESAQTLLGKTDFKGRLPISLPGLYPRGTGIQLKK